MKRGIFTGLTVAALAAIALLAIVHCDSDGGSSCSSWCRKLGQCYEQEYEYYYGDDHFEWDAEAQRECTLNCNEWREDLESTEEREVYRCVMGCRSEVDCEDFFECYYDCYDYNYYYD